MTQDNRQGLFFGITLLIFFFNRFCLPFNLQFTILLFPFFLFYLLKKNRLHHTLKMVVVLLCFGLLATHGSLHLSGYVISTIVLITCIIFGHAFYVKSLEVPCFEPIIEKLTKVNFALTILALIALFVPFLKPIFWYLIPFTAGYEAIPRLKLFELEASHYSLALLPLFLYYFWSVLQKTEKKKVLLLLSLCLSLVLSFSLGVLAVLALSICLVLFFYFYLFLRKENSRKLITGTVFSVFLLGILLWLLFPENPLFHRIANVFNGEDTSGRGRTYEAFIIGWEVLQAEGKELFGVGLGQFKFLGEQILNDFYKFDTPATIIRLPNCMAETMVAYGIVGLVLKVLLQFFLFFKTKVYSNLFRVSLFLALFIYQFTGSFLFNTMEYILWILIFLPKFNRFEKEVYFK